MKNLLLISILFLFSVSVFSQDAANGENKIINNLINGSATGLNTESGSNYSFAAGYYSKAMANGSFGFGKFAKAIHVHSFVFGGGFGEYPKISYLESTEANSFSVGFNTTSPSLFVESFTLEGTAEGFVGIHTTNPRTELDVAGTLTANALVIPPAPFSQLEDGYVLTAIGTNGDVEWRAPSAGLPGGGDDCLWNSTINSTKIYFNTGNVGIGTTNAQEMLHVTGKILTEDGLSMQGLSNKVIFGNDANSTFSILRSTYSKNIPTFDEILTINAANNVGIGTNDPDAELEVVGKTKTSQFQLNSDGNTSGFLLIDSDGNGNSEWVDPLSIPSSGVWSEANNEAYYLGNVGIGTSNPSEALHIEFGAGKAGIVFKSDDETYNSAYPIKFITGVSGNHGKLTQYIPNQGGDYIWTCQPDNGDVKVEGMRLEISPWGTQGKLSINGKINTKSFQLASESNVDGFILQADADGDARWIDPVIAGVSSWTKKSNSNDIYRTSGNIGIGTSATENAKLTVRGKIIAMSMEITEDVPASDYVFEADYPLMPLNELESYVKENKHLPEVKSAKEFKEEGYNIGKMDDVLLRKIEELTLYVIEQQKMIDELREDLKEKSND